MGNQPTSTNKIADLLQTQFKSVFSVTKDNIDDSYSFSKEIRIIHSLSDLEIECQDFVNAINKLKSSSSCPKSEIPARVFKECKFSISTPLKVLWSRSFECGQIPKAY